MTILKEFFYNNLSYLIGQPFTAPTMIPFEKYFCINGYTAKIGKDAKTVIVIRIPFGEIAAIACDISEPLDAVFSCSARRCASLR